MPMNLKHYPAYWRQFSEYIRFERAGNKCEQCGAPNGEIIERGFISEVNKVPIWFDGHGGTYHAETGDFLGTFHDYDLDLKRAVKIVLTVAHLDFDGGICQCKKTFGIKCAKAKHVLALCQACHLRMDLPHHIKNRRNSLKTQKDAKRGLFEAL